MHRVVGLELSPTRSLGDRWAPTSRPPARIPGPPTPDLDPVPPTPDTRPRTHDLGPRTQAQSFIYQRHNSFKASNTVLAQIKKRKHPVVKCPFLKQPPPPSWRIWFSFFLKKILAARCQSIKESGLGNQITF